MFKFTFGNIGSGKSLAQAEEALFLMHQAQHLHKKYPHLPVREVWCNFDISEKYKKKYALHYKRWYHPLEMIFKDYADKGTDGEVRRDFDCMWDEMAVELPSDAWKDTHPEIRRFFAQHRKRGIRIYGNTQDYMMLDINARRMATSVFRCYKIIGSRYPSATLSPIKIIWGLVLVWELDLSSIRKDDADQKKATLIPNFLWITKSLCDIYNTSEDISKGLRSKLLHVEFICDKCKNAGYPEFKYKKIEHIKI